MRDLPKNIATKQVIQKPKHEPLLDTTLKISFEKPTPLDFEAFVPWLCKSWEISQSIIIDRMNQEQALPHLKSMKNLKLKNANGSTTMKNNLTLRNTRSNFSESDLRARNTKKAISIKTYYERHGRLVEIRIIDSPMPISKRVIQAIKVCLPCHSQLTKLTINKGLTYQTIHELWKLLPHSNLTDICLDGTRVAESNYYILLDCQSQLKRLSLNKCLINDIICQKIANRLCQMGESCSSLHILELSINNITDIGAQYLGDMLRNNRSLRHLNLAGNKITDFGAGTIINQLKEFLVTKQEIVAAKRKKFKFLKVKISLYEKLLEEIMRERRRQTLASSVSLMMTLENKSSKNPKKAKKKARTKDLVGSFTGPFDGENTIKRNEQLYCNGNFTLCSLNLGYNNLGYFSVKQIHEVLLYQAGRVKKLNAPGLLRLVLDGNLVPKHCIEYDKIKIFLTQAVQNISTSKKSGLSFENKKSILHLKKKKEL
ncbi:hypothetical protein K1T71_012114 [Dendrolimus kikuchii]|uniref:Uncharacterized protein n=1 Tax=Dendrolimus kikuchii TaxID=765133 RepID=A0ACC1CKM6_9NEOP|nr:hypothetical protein K1T71_012114 [Dendrolimus kikuchii]